METISQITPRRTSHALFLIVSSYHTLTIVVCDLSCDSMVTPCFPTFFQPKTQTKSTEYQPFSRGTTFANPYPFHFFFCDDRPSHIMTTTVELTAADRDEDKRSVCLSVSLRFRRNRSLKIASEVLLWCFWARITILPKGLVCTKWGDRQHINGWQAVIGFILYKIWSFLLYVKILKKNLKRNFMNYLSQN